MVVAVVVLNILMLFWIRLKKTRKYSEAFACTDKIAVPQFFCSSQRIGIFCGPPLKWKPSPTTHIEIGNGFSFFSCTITIQSSCFPLFPFMHVNFDSFFLFCCCSCHFAILKRKWTKHREESENTYEFFFASEKIMKDKERTQLKRV